MLLSRENSLRRDRMTKVARSACSRTHGPGRAAAWFHTGEINAVRQLLGHAEIMFVGPAGGELTRGHDKRAPGRAGRARRVQAMKGC